MEELDAWSRVAGGRPFILLSFVIVTTNLIFIDALNSTAVQSPGR